MSVSGTTPARIVLPVMSLRSYQQRVFQFFDRGGTRAVVVSHRRSGKDCLALNWLVRELWREPGREAFYILPTFTQAKRVLWNGLTDQRRPMMAFVPPQIIASKNENELRIKLVNGSQLSVVGSEQLDALMGTNPSRLVFSEYALQRPDSWDYLRPIITANGGKVLFITTPRGRNHAWQLYAHAEKDPSWLALRLTVSDTRKDAEGEDGGPVISEDAIDKERLEGMPENLIAQEFFCSFAEAVSGAIYGRELADAEAQGRIGPVPYHPGLPVVAAWDIGAGTTAVVVAQGAPPGRCCVIDYVELENSTLPDAVRVLQQKPYTISEHVMPHDFKTPEWTNERSRLGTARSLGLKHIRVLPRLSIDEGIHAARMLLPRTYFDERQTRDLVAALQHYGREWDEDRRVFGVKPTHEWSSHGADAYRYLSLAWRDRRAEEERPMPRFALSSLSRDPWPADPARPTPKW